MLNYKKRNKFSEFWRKGKELNVKSQKGKQLTFNAISFPYSYEFQILLK